MRTAKLLMIALLGVYASSYVYAEESKPYVKLVKSEVISQGEEGENRKFPGKVRAVKRVNMAFQVHGILKELNVKEGEKVSKGQVLARLDERDFKNNLEATQATLKEVRLNYERSKKLYKQQVIPKAKYDEVKAALDALESKTRILEKQLDDTKLIAPFSGVVAKRYVQNFENIAAKSPILSLQDNSGIEVVIQIPESIMIKGVEKKFNSSIVVFDAAPKNSYPAQLSEISTDADPYSQTYSVVLKLNSPDDLNILPGMTATVEVQNETSSEDVKITVPLAAIFADVNNNNYVWRINTKNTLEKIRVFIGEIKGNRVEVKSGVNEGDKLVVAGVNLLEEGEKVRELKK